MIAWFKRLLLEGFPLPLAYDPVTKSPSVTLLFFYLSFSISTLITAISSVYLLEKGEYFTATIMPAISAFNGFIFYRLRALDRIKIDIDDREIELSSDNKEQK